MKQSSIEGTKNAGARVATNFACRFSMAETYPNALSLNSLLMEYRLVSVLGVGAFGITYLARDVNLEKDVAIKEYLPGAVAVRGQDGIVVPAAPNLDSDYRWGLDRFLREARTLAALNHAHIVGVNRFFEAHGTGYMVMDYEDGESLKTFIQRQPFPSEVALKALLASLLDGLDKVHQAGFLHRDIKPDNIFVRKDGTPVLIDFGSARQTVGGATQNLTTIVSPGYAPFEQYTTAKLQGPWSDIYSLSGVLYFAVTGHNPPDSISRMKSDTLQQGLNLARERYSAQFIGAIEWGLALDDRARPRSIAEWRSALLGTQTPSRKAECTTSSSPTTIRTLAINPLSMRVDAAVAQNKPSTPRPSTGPAAVAARLGLLSIQPHWAWIWRYLLVAVAALVLSAILGSSQLFASTWVIRDRLAASQFVKFIGDSAALFAVWLIAQRASAQLRSRSGKAGFLHQNLLPAASLVVLSCAHGVVLSALRPFMDASLRSMYNAIFVLLSFAAAVWLVVTMFRASETLTSPGGEATVGLGGAIDSQDHHCPNCNTNNPRTSRYCGQCATVLGG